MKDTSRSNARMTPLPAMGSTASAASLSRARNRHRFRSSVRISPSGTVAAACPAKRITPDISFRIGDLLDGVIVVMGKDAEARRL